MIPEVDVLISHSFAMTAITSYCGGKSYWVVQDSSISLGSKRQFSASVLRFQLKVRL